MAAETKIANTVEDSLEGNTNLGHLTSLACDQAALPDKWILFQRSALIGQLTPFLVHDILQPLSSIANFSNAILLKTSNGTSPPEQLEIAISTINKEAFRASAIAKQLRSHSRSNVGDETRIQVNEMIRRMLALVGGFLRSEQVVIKTALPHGLPCVLASTSGLEQVILNLIKNAVEAMQDMPPNSRVVEITTREEMGSIQISIEDFGPPISEEIGINLCRPFFTTKVGAMGLGLWASKTILRRNGGELCLLRKASRGIESIVRLPIAIRG